jgi:tRNA threonylcarbamoyladenosine biosynthesis protein TsaE
LHEYRGGKLPVFHWDLYRLGPETDWDLLDLPEHLPSKDGVTVIEWSERYPGPWPNDNCWDIQINIDANDRHEIRICKP